MRIALLSPLCALCLTQAVSHAQTAAISGTVSYAGRQTGDVWIIAATNSAMSTNLVGSRTVKAAVAPVVGAFTNVSFTLTDPLTGANHWLFAWRDSNTNPRKTDSDGDDLPGGWEVQYGLNPLDTADATQISAGGQFTNLRKDRLGLTPLTLDTDGDGLSDCDELFVLFSGNTPYVVGNQGRNQFPCCRENDVRVDSDSMGEGTRGTRKHAELANEGEKLAGANLIPPSTLLSEMIQFLRPVRRFVARPVAGG